MKKLLCYLQPYLIAIIPLIALLKNNPGEIFLLDFGMLLSLLALLIFPIFYAISRWTQDKERTSLAMSVLCSALVVSASSSFISKTVIWSLCVGGFLGLLVLRLPFKWKSTLSYCFATPLLLLACYDLIQIGIVKYTIRQEIVKNQSPLPSPVSQKNCERDVYVIILDEFISEKSFNKYYQSDNSTFFKHLKNKGFLFVDSSTSNYPWTITSVASILNFDYHSTDLPKNTFTGVAQHLIEHNRLFALLQKEGYELYHIPSIYWMGNPTIGPINDCLFRTRSYGLLQTISQMTPWKDNYREYQKQSHREHVFFQMKQLESISEKPGKKLVFAHIMCPHRPIVFDEDGSPFSDQLSADVEKDATHLFYLKQAKFISTQITQTIEHILTNSTIPPIILLFSDHGKFPIGCIAKGKKTLPLQEIAWRFSNLQALYLPEFPDMFSDHITPVNTIRKVLNYYFGYDFPVLEDLCHPHFTDLDQHVSNQAILDCLTSRDGEPLSSSK